MPAALRRRANLIPQRVFDEERAAPVMSAQRGDGRAQIKRIILVAFIAIIASVEFGLYPFSSSVDLGSERPRRYPRWHPRRAGARARP